MANNQKTGYQVEFDFTGKSCSGLTLRFPEKKLVRSEGKLRHEFPNPEHLVNHITTLIGVNRELQKKIEDRENADDKYRSLFDHALVGLFRSTPDGRLIYANLALARMFGYSSPAKMLSTITDLGQQVHSHPARRLDLLKMIDQGAVEDLEFECRHKNGSVVWGSVNGSAIRDNDGNVLYYEGAIQNITRRKSLESMLHQAQKMEAIGTLAGGIAHDFNNILGAIIGYAEMALREPPGSNRVSRYLGQIHKAGLRSRDLVQQILTFSRQSDSSPQPLRLSGILREVMGLLRASLPSTIEIIQDIQSDPDTVLADPTHIHQIVMNLCTNAAQAMDSGKGVLHISLLPIEIKPDDALLHQGLSAGMHIRLTVTDSGRGIASDIIKRIFDPFFTTKRGEGTGMGLAVVHGIIKKYGGAITVQSRAGQGTTFSVYFPLIEEPSDWAPNDPDTLTGGAENILLVDDDPVLVELGQDMLTELGYRVTGRTSSLEALALFRDRPDRFDLVISDMTMPHMTGLELLQEIKRNHPAIPVILCTGFSEAITPKQLSDIGITEFVMKPMVLKQLASSVRNAIDKSKTIAPH